MEGHTLADGLTDFPGSFPEIYRATVAASEQSGHLDAVLEQAGKFAAEIHPVKVKRGKDDVVVDKDDHIKPETTVEALSKLRAAFGKEGDATLHVHDGEHEIDLPAILAFFKKNLKP